MNEILNFQNFNDLTNVFGGGGSVFGDSVIINSNVIILSISLLQDIL